jgi:hypothetical protein
MTTSFVRKPPEKVRAQQELDYLRCKLRDRVQGTDLTAVHHHPADYLHGLVVTLQQQ